MRRAFRRHSLPRVTRTRTVAVAVTGLLAAAALNVPGAHAAGGLWDNCTNYNKTYPHGVGRKNAKDKTSGTPVTTFKRSNKKYATAMRKNDDLDRDGDKIACEKA